MWIKKMLCMVLTCVLLVGLISFPARAVEIKTTTPESFAKSNSNPRATGSFSMNIPARSKVLANRSFRLSAGESVTIRASYTPVSANVDFGLVAPSGVFYYFSANGGNINRTIQISEGGKYTLQVRNNSNFGVDVSGFVNY